jgi:renalase
MVWEIAVVGAGMAGLTCARLLQAAGRQVVVLDKSRGLGGRLATRRLHGTWADHGVRRLKLDGALADLIPTLVDREVLVPWGQQSWTWQGGDWQLAEQAGEDYVSPTGITAVAKALAADLPILRSHRLLSLQPEATHWRLDCAEGEPVLAKAVVMAIPAPQAVPLLQPLLTAGLDPQFEAVVAAIAAVEFEPSLSLMALYPDATAPAPWQTQPWSIVLKDHPQISWISLESSKRGEPGPLTLVVQSRAELAQQFLAAADLTPAAEQLWTATADLLSQSPLLSPGEHSDWIRQPTHWQIQRWRYSACIKPLDNTYWLHPGPRPIAGCGDWCGGRTVAAALRSGQASAIALHAHLGGNPAVLAPFQDSLDRLL